MVAKERKSGALILGLLWVVAAAASIYYVSFVSGLEGDWWLYWVILIPYSLFFLALGLVRYLGYPNEPVLGAGKESSDPGKAAAVRRFGRYVKSQEIMIFPTETNTLIGMYLSLFSCVILLLGAAFALDDVMVIASVIVLIIVGGVIFFIHLLRLQKRLRDPHP